MMETVRRSLPDCGRGLERGCRFMITANLLDDMRVELMFNRFGRDPERVLDREWCAGAVSDDANAVNAEKRTAAIVLVVRFVFDRQERVLGQKCAGLASGRTR